ncbi:MAG: cation:proton antiporter [Pseudomonadota bacterium]
MENFLAQAAIYLAAGVVAVPIAARLGLGSVLGYLLAGIAIGPLLGLVGAETHDLQHFAEFGVVMMLFLIGLELDPRAVWDMRHRLLGLGGAQVMLTWAVIAGLAYLFGQTLWVAITLGMVFALSSTAIVLQTLSEKNLMATPGGRASFSVLLTQDIAVIPMLALLPLLGTTTLANIAPDGSIQRAVEDEAHHTMSLVEGLPGWGASLVTIAAIGLVVFLGVFAMRPAFRFVHMARLRELYTAFALLIVVGIAVLMNMVGLSPALGTFLAGVVLANSEFRHEMQSNLEPFKGLLLGLFFITVGAGIDFGTFLRQPVTILGLTVALMAIKGVILLALAMASGLKHRDRYLFTLGLAQAGEFGFVLIAFALQQNALSPGMGQLALLVVAFSMLFTPLFFIAWEQIAKRLGDPEDSIEHDEIDETSPVIIAGVGRFGQVVQRLVRMSGFPATVLDSDLKTIRLLRSFGVKGFFGDPTRPEILHGAGFDTARVLVVALDNRDAAVQLVTYARRERPDIQIIARAYDRIHAFRLHKAGADKVVREMFDSSLRAGRYVLETMGLADFEASELEHQFFRQDREALRELAELWDPDIPIEENAAYVARSKELDKDLELALAKADDEPADKAG